MKNTSFTALPINHPWKTLAGFIVLVALLATGLGNLTFSNDIRVFFDRDNPELLAYEALEDVYSKSNSVLFVIVPDNGQVFSTSTLNSILLLTEQAWELPYVRRVDSITNFQYSRAEGEDLIVEDLVYDPQELTETEIVQRRTEAISEPMLVNRLISPNADVTAINAVVSLPGKDPVMETPEVAKAARALADRIMQLNPSIKIHLTGLVMINNALGEEGEKDVVTLIPVMLLLVFLIITLVFRSFGATVATLLVFILSVIGAHGVAGWLGIQLSPPTLSAVNIILTLAIADSIHVLSSYFHLFKTADSKQQAMQESLRINFWPVALTSVTTAIGFLTMLGSESPPFRDLGTIVAAGIIAAWITSIWLLPALMMLIPHRTTAPVQGRIEGLMEALSSWVIRQRGVLLPVISLLVVALALFVPKNEINDEFVRYFDHATDFRQATEFTIERLTGFEFIEYSIESGAPGGVNDAEYLQLVDDFAHWFREQPLVRHVSAYSDMMKRINKNINNDDPAAYKIPQSRELAAQYLLLYEMSLPLGLDLRDQINIDKSATRFRVSLDHISTNEMLELEQSAMDWLDSHASSSITARATGQSLMFAHIGQRNTISLLATTTFALILISFILIFALRSLKFGLLSLVPNLAPVFMAFGLWAVFVGQVGLALSVVVGMTLGIIVDDTVHFLSKYLRARREQGLDAEQAIRYAFTSVGTALWITSLVLIAGFAVLMLSRFELNSSMGILSAVTISMALIADFFLLPCLLMKVDGKAEKS